MSADKLEQRVTDLERYYVMLVEMMRRHDERIDEVRAEAANADARIAALADAQIKTDAAMHHADERIAALVDAHIKTEDALLTLGTRTDERINALIDAITRHTADGHGGA